MNKKTEELMREFNRIRKGQKISQRELADKIGIYQPQIAMYENGKITPGIEVLVEMLDCMGYKIKFVPKNSEEE